MDKELFVVKVNLAEGTIEVSGSDKAWVDEKLSQSLPLLQSGQRNGEIRSKQKASVSPSATSKQKNVSQKTKVTIKLNEQIGRLFSEKASSLEAWVEDRKTHFKKTTDQAAIVAAFLKDELGVEIVSAKDMDYIYRQLGWPTINHTAQLSNASKRERGGYLENVEGGYRLTHSGLKFGRDTSKQAERSE